MPLLNRLRFSRREPQNENRRAARLAAPKLGLKLSGLLQTVTPDRTIVYVDGFKISTAENSVTRRESGWIPCRLFQEVRESAAGVHEIHAASSRRI